MEKRPVREIYKEESEGTHLHKALRLVITFLIAVVLGTMYWTAPALAAGEPAITGKVVNGTAGGGPVDGLEVTLTTYMDFAPSDQQTTVTDTQGNFQFSGLTTNATYSYDLYVTYKGVPYTSDIIYLTTSNATQSAELKVYETTNSDTAVKISAGHMIIVPTSPGVLNVMETWRVNNSGNSTYIGSASDSTQATAHFTLPEGATDFSADTGISVFSETGIVTYTLPIVPGASSISFYYSLSYQGSDAAIDRTVDYPTPSLSILVPQNGIVAKSTMLTQTTFQSPQGTTYLYLIGSNLQKGQKLDISLNISQAAFSADTSSNPSSPNTTLQNGISWQLVLLVILALGVVFAVIYPRLKRRGVTVTPVGTGTEGSTTDIEEEVLMERLARLDDSFDAGEIAEAEYKERRAKAKERLMAIRIEKKKQGISTPPG